MQKPCGAFYFISTISDVGSVTMKMTEPPLCCINNLYFGFISYKFYVYPRTDTVLPQTVKPGIGIVLPDKG